MDSPLRTAATLRSPNNGAKVDRNAEYPLLVRNVAPARLMGGRSVRPRLGGWRRIDEPRMTIAFDAVACAA